MNNSKECATDQQHIQVSKQKSSRKLRRFLLGIKRNLPDYKSYLQLRRLHQDTVRRISFGYLKKNKDYEVAILEKQALLKRFHLRRLINWYIILPLILILAALSLYLIQPMDSTKIYADLYVSAISFETSKGYAFQSADIDSSNLSEAIMLNGNVRDDADHSKNNADALIKADKGEILALKELTIPENATVSIFKPRPGGLEITIQQKGNNEVTGKIDIFNGSLVLDSPIIYHSSKSEDEKIPTTINFQKNFEDNVNFNLSMIMCKWFELPKIYVNRIKSFNNKNAMNEKSSSAVMSGSILLLDTDNDSIILKRGDSLKIGFKETPVKLSVQAEYKAIHVSFEAEVNELKAGPEILSKTEKLDQMPLRIKTLYYKAPYVWAILIAVLPILLPYLFRQREENI